MNPMEVNPQNGIVSALWKASVQYIYAGGCKAIIQFFLLCLQNTHHTPSTQAAGRKYNRCSWSTICHKNFVLVANIEQFEYFKYRSGFLLCFCSFIRMKRRKEEREGFLVHLKTSYL